MTSINLSPSLISKLRIKDAVDRMKHKSPQLQEVFRQRCRERMKERRSQIFNRRRLGLELGSMDVEHTLADVLCQEIGNLENADCQKPIEITSYNIKDDWSDENLTHEINTEPCMDETQWIFEEYERMLQYEMEWFESLLCEDTNEVICPLCQKHILFEDSNSIICKPCGLCLKSDLKTIKNLIDNCVTKHSINCYSVPGFTVVHEDGNNSLYMTCEDCSSLTFVL